MRISKSKDDWKLQPLQASSLGRVPGSNWWSQGKVYHWMALHLVKFYSLGFLKYHTYRDQSDMVSSLHQSNGPSFDSNLSCFLERYLSIPWYIQVALVHYCQGTKVHQWKVLQECILTTICRLSQSMESSKLLLVLGNTSIRHRYTLTHVLSNQSQSQLSLAFNVLCLRRGYSLVSYHSGLLCATQGRLKLVVVGMHMTEFKIQWIQRIHCLSDAQISRY